MICEKHSDCEDCRTREAALRDEMRRNNRSWYEGIARHEQQVSELNTRDRELVEKLEGLAAQWDKENSLRSDDSYRYPQQLRAVLAARSPVHGNLAPEVPAEQPRCSHGELVEKLEELAAEWDEVAFDSGHHAEFREGHAYCAEDLLAVLAARNEVGGK